MNIGILAVDSIYPNLALMKISSYHKQKDDNVEWYNPLCLYDKVYMAKVFSFTPDYGYYINSGQVEKGGTGYDIKKTLPVEVDRMAPDYGLQQIEKIISMGVRVDFNQGLDARLVTDDIAQLLAKVKWIKRIRFGCDTPAQIEEVERAASLIDKYGFRGEYFLYCILMDFEESFRRVNHWKNISRRFIPHGQPFRDLNNPRQVIPQWQKDMAHWADRKELYMSCEFKDYSPRKGFVCSEYF